MIKNKIFSTVLAFVSLLLIYSCEKDEEEMLFQNQYVFLEQHYYTQSELLEGYSPHVVFDFPTYSFDSSTGILTDYGENVEMNKSIQIILGTGSSASGDALSGGATKLLGIQKTPCKYADFNITNLDADGTVYFSYKDSVMVLLPNEEWLVTSSEIKEEIDNGDIIGIVKYTYTNRITNWGLLTKESFIKTDEFD